MGDEFVIAVLINAVLCSLLMLYFYTQVSKLKAKIDATTIVMKEDERQREAFKRELQELRSGTIGMGRRVVDLEKRLNQQSERIEETNQQDPQARLYTRAMKMVALGAGVDELITECELPKAEAELLLRLHQK